MPDDGGLHALRYGEEWRDLTGDKLVFSLAYELNEEREKNAQAKKLIEEAYRKGQEDMRERAAFFGELLRKIGVVDYDKR